MRLDYSQGPVREGNRPVTAIPLPKDVTLHQWVAGNQFQGLGAMLAIQVPLGTAVDLPFLDHLYKWLQELAPDASFHAVGSDGQDITCAFDGHAKLRRRQPTFQYTIALGVAPQFAVYTYPVKVRRSFVAECGY